MARKYAALPELLTPRATIRNIMTQAASRYKVKYQIGAPGKYGFDDKEYYWQSNKTANQK